MASHEPLQLQVLGHQAGRRMVDQPPEEQVVDAVVTVELPEFELVKVAAANGDTFSIGKRTKGVSWRDLHEGQRVRCHVIGAFATRVVSAELLA